MSKAAIVIVLLALGLSAAFAQDYRYDQPPPHHYPYQYGEHRGYVPHDYGYGPGRNEQRFYDQMRRYYRHQQDDMR